MGCVAAQQADEADEAPGEVVRGLVRAGTLDRQPPARVLACLGASQLIRGVRRT